LLIGGGNFIMTMLILTLKAVSVLIATFSLYSGYKNRSFGPVVVGLVLAGIV